MRPVPEEPIRLSKAEPAPTPPPCTCHVGANGWHGIVPPPPCAYHDPYAYSEREALLARVRRSIEENKHILARLS